MKTEEKIKHFEESCQKMLNREVTELNKQIDSEIQKQMKNELEEYQEKEELAYQKKLENLQKDYNKQLYCLEMESKKEVLNQKKAIQKDLEKEVVNLLRNFTKTPEYETFLYTKIEQTIQKLENRNTAMLGLLAFDNQKYGEKIRQKYQMEIKIIEDSYIGGCILEDKTVGIYIDNTLAGSIQESVETR